MLLVKADLETDARLVRLGTQPPRVLVLHLHVRGDVHHVDPGLLQVVERLNRVRLPDSPQVVPGAERHPLDFLHAERGMAQRERERDDESGAGRHGAEELFLRFPSGHAVNLPGGADRSSQPVRNGGETRLTKLYEEGRAVNGIANS